MCNELKRKRGLVSLYIVLEVSFGVDVNGSVNLLFMEVECDKSPLFVLGKTKVLSTGVCEFIRSHFVFRERPVDHKRV